MDLLHGVTALVYTLSGRVFFVYRRSNLIARRNVWYANCILMNFHQDTWTKSLNPAELSKHFIQWEELPIVDFRLIEEKLPNIEK